MMIGYCVKGDEEDVSGTPQSTHEFSCVLEYFLELFRVYGKLSRQYGEFPYIPQVFPCYQHLTWVWHIRYSQH